MTLLDEIQDYFGTKDLYEVINVDKQASESQIKKAYRKASLKIHPDRVAEEEKDKATKRFQVLAQVHYVLSDPEKRTLYDDHGIIANDDSLDKEADWTNYWRLLFPKISEDDIQKFLDSYVGSKDEEADLIAIYNRFEGDLDKISETHISFDEERTTEQLRELIDEGKINEFKKFAKESVAKKASRGKRAAREAKQAEKMRGELQKKTGRNIDNFDDLTALIQRKSQGNFDNMIASLEARYSSNSSKGLKRKRGDK